MHERMFKSIRQQEWEKRRAVIISGFALVALGVILYAAFRIGEAWPDPMKAHCMARMGAVDDLSKALEETAAFKLPVKSNVKKDNVVSK